MALLSQFVATVCAFIIGRKILATFGSEANGLLQSVTRFMSFITLLEGGFGGVIKATLYKPLHQKDQLQLCKLFNSMRSIFKKLSLIVLIYAIVIGIFYKKLSESSYDWWTCFCLVLVISAATITEYVGGISYNLILQADRKVYISASVGIIFCLVRLIVMYLVILINGSLIIIKFTFLIVLFLRVLVLRSICRRHYDLTITKEKQVIKNRWDGMIQHIAYTIHNNVDIIMITLFMSLKDVSVYSVYSMVVAAVNKVIKAISIGISATIGKIIASGDNEKLCVSSEKYMFSSAIVSVSLFASVSGMVMPFICLYTKGISDADYINILYAYLIIVAESVYCLRIPIKTIIGAAGHYRQTRNGSMVEALLNLFLSLILIRFMGVPGILLATLIAMIYRTMDLTIYMVKHLLLRKTKVVPILMFNFILVLATSLEMLISKNMQCHSYLMFIIIGIILCSINLVFVTGFNLLIFGDVIGIREKIVSIVTKTYKYKE